MNKIKVFDDEIKSDNLDGKVKYEIIPKNYFFDVTTLSIEVLEDTTLVLEYSTRKATKINIKIKVLDNVNLELIEYRYGKNFKVQYEYNIEKNSNVKVEKFYDVKGIKEMTIINLQDENASIDYNFKTISVGCEKYNMIINHNSKLTNSNIINNAVNILKGNVSFNVSSFVTEHNINCNVVQNSRIVNLTNNKCQIKPNLFIDEYEVDAYHAAYIGSLDKDEVLYLNSRGIDTKTSEILLVNGFLTKDMPRYLLTKIKRNVDKYWRG